uniref:Putative secreted protein n=1 Tax=Panstrongylus lignarius TaxID=156445 RepID=A0A224XTP1_9HEMI
MVHFISAGGLLLAVVQVRGTASPTLASVGPEIVTCAGAKSTVKSTSALSGAGLIILEASHLYLALLSLASAVNV